jgi:TonB family protein
MRSHLTIVALGALLASCAAPNTGVVRRTDADYYYTDWRTIPSQKAFDVAAAPQQGMAVFIANLRYPIALRYNKVRGEVKVLVSLHSAGRVLDVRLVRSVHPVLDRMVVQAVYHTRWSPAQKDGVPIPLRFYLPVNFS